MRILLSALALSIAITALTSCSQEKQNTQIRGKTPRIRLVKPIFGLDRPEPAPYSPLPTRTQGKHKGPLPPQLSREQLFSQIQACTKKYTEEWEKLKTPVTNRLRSASPICWSQEQRHEVAQLDEAINRLLDELSGRTDGGAKARVLNRAGTPAARTHIEEPLDGATEESEQDELQQTHHKLIELGSKYLSLQESLSYCRLKDLTGPHELEPRTDDDSNSEITPTDSALLHVVGDLFGRDSGLEGQTFLQAEVTLELRKHILTQLLRKITTAGSHYILSDDQANPCRALGSSIAGIYANHDPRSEDRGIPLKDFEPTELQAVISHLDGALSVMKAMRTSLKDFREEFVKQVSGLRQRGDYFYFLGGSTDHAVVYQVVHEDHSLCSFRVYNSGDGKSFHPSIQDGSSTRVFPFLERTGISKAKLTQFAFLKALQDLQTFADNSKISFLYENILSELGGMQTTRVAAEEEVLEPQISGTCSYTVIPYRETSSLSDPTRGSHLEFFVKSQFIDVYFKMNKKRIQAFERIRQLTSKSVTFYAEEVAKNMSVDPGRKGRYIDWGMARESHERLERYHALVNGVQDTLRATRSALSRKWGANQIQAPDLTNIVRVGIGNSGLSPIQTHVQKRDPIAGIEADTWQPQATTLHQDLKGFVQKTGPETSPAYYYSSTQTTPNDHEKFEIQKALSSIPEIIQKIPLDEGWWRELKAKPQQLAQTLSELRALNQVYFWALVRWRTTEINDRMGLPAVAVLTQLKFLTLADHVIQLYGKTDPGRTQGFHEFGSLYNPLMGPLVLDRESGKNQWMSYLTVNDPQAAASFHSLITYWQRERDDRRIDQPIFLWERFALYSCYANNYDRECGQFSPQTVRKILATGINQAIEGWSAEWKASDFSGWPDLLWLSKRFTQPTQVQVLDAARSMNSKISPAYFDSRDIAFLTSYVLSGSFSSKILTATQLSNLVDQRMRNPYAMPHFLTFSWIAHRERIWAGYQSEPPYRDELRFYDVQLSFLNQNPAIPKELFKDPQYRWVPMYGRFANVDPHFALEVSAERPNLGPWSQILEARAHYPTPTGAEKGTAPYYRRLHSLGIIAQPQERHRVPLKKDPTQAKEVAITTLELQRHLLNLGSPLATLGYFRENPMLLKEKRWQILFKALIFQPELLAQESKKTSHLPHLISDFCWKNYQSFTKNEDYLGALFFLRMHHLLEEISPTPKRSARKEMIKLVAHYPSITDARNIILRDVIRTFKNTPLDNASPEDLALLIQAVLYREQHALADSANVDTQEENDVYGLYQNKQASLSRALARRSPEERNQVFNHVFHSLHPLLGNYQWDCQPTSSGACVWQGTALSSHDPSPITLELTRPSFSMSGGEERVLPGLISALPRFQANIRWNSDHPYANWLGGDRYAFIDSTNHPVRVDATPAHAGQPTSLTIQKKWGNRWYQLLDDAWVNEQARTSNWMVMPGYRNWQSIPSPAGDTSGQAPPAYTQEAGLDWSAWNGGFTEFLYFEPTLQEAHDTLFAVGRTGDGSHNRDTIQKVRNVGGQPQLYHTTLQQIPDQQDSRNDRSLSFLSRVELKRWIWVWKNKEGQIEKVELPRFGISFHPEFNHEGNRLISPELENYALSEDQQLPAGNESWGDFSHYLILTSHHKTRIYLPRVRFMTAQENSQNGLTVTDQIDWFTRSPDEQVRKPEPIHWYGRNSQKYFLWALDTFDHQLKLPSEEDRYYLAFIHLWGHPTEYPSYDRSLELLYGSRSQLGALRQEAGQEVPSGAREILQWIFETAWDPDRKTEHYPWSNYDADPRALALRLGAGALVTENDWSYHRYDQNNPKELDKRESEFFVKHQALLKTSYAQYLRQRTRISPRFLPDDLELLLAQHLSQNNPLITARVQELKGTPPPSMQATKGKGLPVVNNPFNSFWTDADRLLQRLETWSGVHDPSKHHVFSGIPVPFTELYAISLGLDAPTLIQPQLIAALATILQTPRETLRSLKPEDLKAEYLTYLKLIIFQHSHYNSSMSGIDAQWVEIAHFLYSLSMAPGNRETLRSLTLNDSRSFSLNQLREKIKLPQYPSMTGKSESEREREAQQYRTEYAEYARQKASIEQGIALAKLNQSSELAAARPHYAQYNLSWSRGEYPTSHPATHWDRREDAIPAQGFKYRYSRVDHPDDHDSDLTEHSLLGAQDLDSWIHVRALNDSEQESITRNAHELAAVFKVEPLESKQSHDHEQDLFIHSRLEQTQKQITDKAQVDLKKQVYEWSQPAAGSSTQPTFATRKAELEQRLKANSDKARAKTKALENEIIQRLRELPQDPYRRAKEMIFKASAVEAQPQLKDILRIYASKRSQKIFLLNAGLSTEQAQTIFNKVTSYLIHSSYYFRAEEILSELKNLSDGTDHRPRSDGEDLERFYQLATSKRAYDIADHPDYLAFEHSMRSLMRAEQVKNLATLTEEDTPSETQAVGKSNKRRYLFQSALLEMIMGAGKTSVLLPLASHQHARSGQQLSLVVLPEALVPSMAKQLSASLEEVFGQGVDRLSIQRKDKYDTRRLQYFYDRLKWDFENERVVVTSNSSIQSLFLIFIEALHDYDRLSEAEQPKKQTEIVILQDIFQLLRHYGYVIIDEVDSILDIMAAHRFSLGTKVQLEPQIIRATLGLYRILAQDEEIVKKVKIPFLRESKPGSKPFSREAFETDIRPRLIAKVAEPESASFFFDQPEQIEAFKAIGSQRIRDYLNSKTMTGAKTFIDSLPYDDLKDIFTVVLTQIHQILPLTLDKTYLVHYGLCPESSEMGGSAAELAAPVCHPFIAIPYRSGSAVITSRFGTDLEALNYAVQSHLERGDVLEMFKLEVAQLQKAFRQNRTSKKIREQFKFYFGEDLSDGVLLNMSSQMIQNRAKIIAFQPDRVLRLVDHHAAPKIEIFEDQLFTNSHIYPVIFKKIQGMTGTLWNAESFPQFYDSDKTIASDSLGRTLSAIWKQPQSRTVRVLDTPASGEALQTTLNRMLNSVTNPVSIIDQGGFFKGKRNQEVAEAMFDTRFGDGQSYQAKGVHQIIFYDSEQQIQTLSRDGNHSRTRAYSSRDITREHSGAFWDMQHTTGSDLKVRLDTVGLLTLSKFSIMRDLLQSAWRLRGLERGQSVRLIISRDDLKVIYRLLESVYGQEQMIRSYGAHALDANTETTGLNQMLLFLATYEAIKAGELNFRSVKATQNTKVVDQVFNKIVDRNSFGTDLIDAFDHVRRFFSSPRGTRPSERYGAPVVRTGTLEFLREQFQRAINAVAQAFPDLAALREQFEQILFHKKGSLRKTVVVAAQEDMEVGAEMEVETENDQEQEQEQEAEQEYTIHNIDPLYDKVKINWDHDKFFNFSYLSEQSATRNSIPTQKMDPQQIAALSPLLSIRAILTHDSLTQLVAQRVSSLFDPRIYGSRDLFPFHQSNGREHDLAFVPFGPYQGLIDYVWVVLDQNEQVKDMVMLTRDEAVSELGEWLLRDHDAQFSRGDHHQRSPHTLGCRSEDRCFSLIYQFGNGFIRHSGNWTSLSDSEELHRKYQELETVPEVQKLLMQIKFLSGRVYYNATEVPYLKEWFKETGGRVYLKGFMENSILKYKETTHEGYADSVLKEEFAAPDDPEYEEANQPLYIETVYCAEDFEEHPQSNSPASFEDSFLLVGLASRSGYVAERHGAESSMEDQVRNFNRGWEISLCTRTDVRASG
jgi:hypothetical protein